MSKLSELLESLKLKKLKPVIVRVTSILSIFSLMVVAPLASVQADRFDDQINALKQQNNQAAANQQALQAQEADIASAIAALQANIAAIEAQISANQAKHRELVEKIAALEVEIASQRQLLGQNIKQLYLDGDMSSLEKLAASKSFSHYVDKEQYNLTVQNKIKTTLDRINELKKEQETQKVSVEKLIADQQVMQSQLAAQRAESQRLLSLNQAQQAEYGNSVRANNSKISELQRQQAAENAKHRIGTVSYGGSGSGYPWANAPFPNSISDPWGMYKRQCVSYTAWRVASSGRHMPYWGGRGNANQWDDNARAASIPIDYNPRVGDVAVSNSGYYGHVMYVEATHGDGSITVSDYNSNLDGRYAYYRRSTAGLVFIHF